jgi:hypothetical protein
VFVREELIEGAGRYAGLATDGVGGSAFVTDLREYGIGGVE